MRKLLAVILIYFFNSGLLLASEKDSLQQVINTSQIDTLKVQALNELSKIYIDIDKDSSLLFVEEGLKLAEKINYKAGIINSYKSYGILYFYKHNFEKAREYFSKGLVKAEKNKFYTQTSSLYYLMGATYYYQDKYDLALALYKKSLKIAEEIKEIEQKSNCYNAIGIVLKEKGEYKEAIDYYLKALKIAEENNYTEQKLNLYNNIGVLYKNQELFDKAIEYFEKALKAIKNSSDKVRLEHLYNNMANSYRMKKDYDNAYIYYKKSLDLATEIKDSLGLRDLHNNLGDLYYDQKQYNKALAEYNKALLIGKAIDKDNIPLFTYSGLGILYFALSDTVNSKTEKNKYLKQAINYSEKAYKKAKEIDAFEIIKNTSKTLMNAYNKIGNKNKAFYYVQEYVKSVEKFYSLERLNAVTEIEKKYNKEKEKLLIEKLQKEQDLRNAKLKYLLYQQEIHKTQKIVFSIISLFLILIVIYIAINLVKNKKKNKQLNQLNKEIKEKSKQVKLQYLESVKQNIEIQTKAREIELQKQVIEQKQKEIKQADEDYKAIIDSNTDIVFIISKEGKVLFINNRAEMMLGYDKEDIIGKSFNMFVPQSEVEGYLIKLNQAFSNKGINAYESYLKHKEGRHIPVEISGQIVEYKGELVGAGTIRDITERKIAEQEIKDKTNKYELVTSAIDDLIWMIDFNKNFIYISPSCKQTIGYTEEELLRIDFYNLFTEASLKKLNNIMALARVSSDKNKRVSEVLEYIHKDGTKAEANIIGHIVFENNEAIGFVTVSRFCDKSIKFNKNE